MAARPREVGKTEKIADVADAVYATRDLGSAYVTHLRTFLEMSRDMQSATKALDAIASSLDRIPESDLDLVRATKLTLQKAVSQVRSDFDKQVNDMLANPHYNDELKKLLRQVQADFASIDAATRSAAVGGAPPQRAGRKGAARKTPAKSARTKTPAKRSGAQKGGCGCSAAMRGGNLVSSAYVL